MPGAVLHPVRGRPKARRHRRDERSVASRRDAKERKHVRRDGACLRDARQLPVPRTMSMRRSFSLDRRTLLRGTAGTALSLPLLEAMFEKRVYPQVANAPKRFIFAYCGIPPCGEEVDKTTGKPPQFVIPDAPGALTAALKVGLEPLEMLGLKGDTTVISSLRIPRTGSANGRRFGSSGFHYETMGPIVSGVSVLNDNFSRQALGPSSDWLLAQAIGSATRFPSLVYIVQSAEHTSGYTVDYISFSPHAVKNQYDAPTTRNDPIV